MVRSEDSIVSTMPQITASTGLSLVTSVRRALDPAATSTSSPYPAPTASAATTQLPVGFMCESTSRVRRSLSPSRFESLRVETTVPTTSARITLPALARSPRSGSLLGLRAADGQHVLESRVWTRDDVDRDHLAHLGG